MVEQWTPALGERERATERERDGGAASAQSGTGGVGLCGGDIF